MQKLFLAENLIRELQRRLSRSSAGGSIVPSVDSRGSGGASYAMAGLSSPHHSSSASEDGASSGGNYLGLAYGKRDDEICTPADALCAPGDVDEDADSHQAPSVQKPSVLNPAVVIAQSVGGEHRSDSIGSIELDIETSQR